MFGLSLVKTSSLNKMRADNTQLGLDKESLTSQLGVVKGNHMRSMMKIEALQKEKDQLEKQLAINKPQKDPRSGRFVKKTVHSDKSRAN